MQIESILSSCYENKPEVQDNIVSFFNDVKSDNGFWLLCCEYEKGDIPTWEPLSYMTDLSSAYFIMHKFMEELKAKGDKGFGLISGYIKENNKKDSICFSMASLDIMGKGIDISHEDANKLPACITLAILFNKDRDYFQSITEQIQSDGFIIQDINYCDCSCCHDCEEKCNEEINQNGKYEK